MLYAKNVVAIDFIDEQSGTMIRIHIPSKFVYGEVLLPDEANVSENFTVPLRNVTQSCWEQ